MKYLCWGSIGLYFYHLWACQHYENPEDFTHDEKFLYAAMWTRVAYRDLYELLTQPPVKALLGERFIPPGYAARPTLVLSVNGVLVHSEYKVIPSRLANVIIVRNWLRNCEETRSVCVREQNGSLVRLAFVW